MPIDSPLVALNIDANLQAHYGFENSGDLGNDTSPGAGFDATVNGASAAVDGTRGNVLSLDGNDYLQSSGHFGNPTEVALAAWVTLPTAYPGLPTRPIRVHPLPPAALVPDKTQGALCRIFVKALASFSAIPETCVAWAPASPLAISLRILGITPLADAAWH